MPWVKVDDHFDEHPKMQQVGPLGWGVWVAGLAYCNRNLTDGFIPWNKARTLCSFEIVEDDGRVWDIGLTSNYAGDDVTAEWIIGLLVNVGLWDVVENGRGRIDGYRIHDYDDYQPSKEEVLAERAKNAERQARHRQRKAESSHDDDTVTSIEVTHDVTPLVTDDKRTRNECPVPDPVSVPPVDFANAQSTEAAAAREDDSSDGLTDLERNLVAEIRLVRGMGPYSDEEIATEIREANETRGAPVSDRAMLADAKRFRKKYTAERMNQPVDRKWRGGKTAVFNWFSRTKEQSYEQAATASRNGDGSGRYADPAAEQPTISEYRPRQPRAAV